MFTTLLLSTVLLSPAAPVPKATKPIGPPPKLVYVAPAKQGGQVVVMVQIPRKVTETIETNVTENGMRVTKATTREREVLTSQSVSLENAGAAFKTPADKALTAEEANEKLKNGGVLVVPAPGEDEVDAAYAKLLAADAILVSYKADKAEEKKRLAVNVSRVQPVAAAPAIVAVKADDKGVVNVPARGTKEETVKVPIAKNVNGEATIEYQEVKRTVTALVPAPFDQIKPEVTTADGKAVAADDAKKQLAAGALVLVSTDGKPVDEMYRKLFQPATLVLASEKMTVPANNGLLPAVRGAIGRVQAVPAAPAQAVPEKP